jgi:hypothetical protein
MTKKRISAPKVKAEATAKAVLVAKATYQRKRISSEIIPADVTRAKAGAWLDLISPLTEWAGLRGDQIRHKREMLRVQREEVIEKIGRRVSLRLSKHPSPTQSIPTKFIVPFLEKASLEDLNSELIETWCNLLTSAATNFNHHMVRFCSILSEIGPAEVKFMSRLCRDYRGPKRTFRAIDDVPMAFSPGELIESINDQIETSKGVRQNVETIIARHELPGGLLLVLGMEDQKSDELIEEVHDLDDRRWEPSISLLQSLGLIENQILISGRVKNYSWFAETVSLTSFGVAFVSACDQEIGRALKD